MTYTKQTWADGTGGGTPLSSGRLNHMEDGIALVDTKAPVLTPTATKTGAYTLAAGDFVPVDATSANVPLTLPTAPADGTRAGAKLVATASNHTATLTCGGSDKINTTTGGTTYTLSVVNQAVQFQYQASVGVWIVVASDLPLSQLDTRYTASVRPWAASTAYNAGDLSVYQSQLYRRKATGTSAATFDPTAWDPIGVGSGMNNRIPIRARSRGTLVLGNQGTAGVPQPATGTLHIHPERVVFNPEDRLYYMLFMGSTGTQYQSWARSTTPYGPWTDLGSITGIATGFDAADYLRWGANHYIYCGGSTGAGISLYKSTTTINGTYSLVTSNIVPVGAAGKFNENRCDEPTVFVQQHAGAATLGMLFMGFDSGNAHEQVGYATASTPEGTWTVQNSGNPVIANGTTYDALVCADPFVLYKNGLYYCFYVYGPAGSIADSGRYGLALATTPDMATFTKQGVVLAPPALPSGGSAASWRGVFFEADDETIYWTHGGADAANDVRHTQAYLDVLDASSLFDGVPHASQWKRVEAGSGDGRLIESGTWIAAGGVYVSSYSGGAARASNTTASKTTFTFRGSAIRVGTASLLNCGIANVYIDDVLVATVDAYQSGTKPAVPFLYENLDLPGGDHKIAVEVSGTKNAAASDQYLFVDYFEYIPAL